MTVRVAIFEPDPFGHRLQYVRLMVGALQELQIRPVLVSSARAIRSEEHRMSLGPLGHSFDVHVLDWPCLNSQGCDRRSLAIAMMRYPDLDPFDVVWIPSGDGLAQWMAMKSVYRGRGKLPGRCETLLLGGQFGYPAAWRRRVRNRLVAGILRPGRWRSLFHLDPWQHEYLSRAAPGWKLMPDPVEVPGPCPAVEARRRLGLDSGGFWLGMAGWIERSKGADSLVRAFRDALPRLPDEARLLLAGKLEPGLREWVMEHCGNLVESGRILVWDRLLSENELDDALRSLDIMCLPYRRSMQSSGIYLRSVAADIPVLTTRHGWLGRMNQWLGGGWQVDPGVHDELVECLVRAANSRPARPDGERLERFLEYHSVANFQAAWTERLRRDCGLPDHPARRSWQWVTGTPVESPDRAAGTPAVATGS